MAVSPATATLAGAPAAPFGRVLTAMVTPFSADGRLDLDRAQRLATHLVEHGSDGLVLNGTTGESPTTSDAEKDRLVRAVVEAVGGRAHVLAGAGSNDTAHSVSVAAQVQRAGAHGLLVVSPYYSRPSQDGLLTHFRAVADATELPVMLYDIPGRTGVAIETDTLVRLAEHPRIVANKDAKGDLAATSCVLARSDLATYSGDDVLTLPLLAVGASGVVSVVAHLVGERMAQLVAAHLAGDVVVARSLHHGLLPVFTAVMNRMQGVVAVKAALARLGLPCGSVRLPLLDATEDEVARLVEECGTGGLRL